MPVAWWFLRIPPHWSSNKPPAVASDRCLYRLPIILLALNTKQRGKEIVYIEGERRSDQKEQRERVIGSIERRFFSPGAQGRFHWKAVAVYRSAFRDGYCEAKDGERKKERGGGIHAERETQRHSSIQLCSRRIRVSERTARNKSRETWHSQNVEPVDVLCDIEIFLCWSTISVAMSCVEPCSVSKKGRKENSTDKKQ